MKAPAHDAEREASDRGLDVPYFGASVEATGGEEAEMAMYAVRVARGGPWDWSRDMREQGDWDAHASFMNGLVDDGVILLGGPLEGDREVLHAVEAQSEEAIRARLAEDPWAKRGLVTVTSVERWTILLDGRS